MTARCLNSLAVVALALAIALPLSLHAAGTRTVDIAISNGVVIGAKSVRVTRGDTVVLRFTSDVPFELHLHGYDVTALI